MGMLLMMFRKLNLIQRKNNIEFQLTDANQQLLDYQNTSSALSNDSVSITDLASVSPSLFGPTLNHLMMAHGAATQYAEQSMAYMNSNSIFQQYGDQAPQMQQIAYMKAYESAREQVKKRIMAQLNQKEKQLEMKKTRLETQLAAIEKEEEGVSQRLQKGVEHQVAHYGLGG